MLPWPVQLHVIGVGLLASGRPDGWWLPALGCGLLPTLVGLASLVFLDVSRASARSEVWW
jgi:hypothetical protein